MRASTTSSTRTIWLSLLAGALVLRGVTATPPGQTLRSGDW